MQHRNNGSSGHAVQADRRGVREREPVDPAEMDQAPPTSRSPGADSSPVRISVAPDLDVVSMPNSKRVSQGKGCRMDRTVRSALSPIFEIGERFAVGRRGNSYFATVRETGQPVVLKSFFRPVDDEKLEILSRLIEVSERNAGIADVLMVGRLPSGRWFQAREQSDGVPLSEWLSQGALLPQDLSTILIQCALALQALHDAGLAHGSVSPENIIVQSGPNGPTAKFVDVGAVRGLNKRRQRADLRSLAAMGWVASHQQSHAGIDRADNPIQQAMFFGLEQVGRRTMAAPASSGRSLASQMQRGVQPPAVTPRSRRFGFGPMTLRSADLVSVI